MTDWPKVLVVTRAHEMAIVKACSPDNFTIRHLNGNRDQLITIGLVRLLLLESPLAADTNPPVSVKRIFNQTLKRPFPESIEAKDERMKMHTGADSVARTVALTVEGVIERAFECGLDIFRIETEVLGALRKFREAAQEAERQARIDEGAPGYVLSPALGSTVCRVPFKPTLIPTEPGK